MASQHPRTSNPYRLTLMSMAYIAVATAVISAIGAATSYVGAQKSADAAEDAGKAQKAAADASARNEELQGAETIKRERLNKQRRLARLRSDMNRGGVVMDGSSMDVFGETAGAMELQLQDASRAMNMDASNQRSAGAMSLWEARSQAAGTRLAATGTLLSDSASIAGGLYKSGAFSGSSKPAATT